MRATQVRKLVRGVSTARGRQALRAGVAATGEHEHLLARLEPATVIDVGANRGQFALDVEAALPEARVYSFEPMSGAAATFRRVFGGNSRYSIVEVALGAGEGSADLHVSRHDDSSSLLPIGAAQVAFFPGTEETAMTSVRVTTLDSALRMEALVEPVLVKIDVQGFELEVLRGAVETLDRVRWIYVECSFEELYDGQPLASDVIDWLRTHSFHLRGIGAIAEVGRRIVQADLLFERRV